VSVEALLVGHMVSIAGQLDLQFVPFSDLIAPGQLRTDVRFIERGSDFHALAHALGTRLPST
jgi:6-phosphofructokinase 1